MYICMGFGNNNLVYKSEKARLREIAMQTGGYYGRIKMWS